MKNIKHIFKHFLFYMFNNINKTKKVLLENHTWKYGVSKNHLTEHVKLQASMLMQPLYLQSICDGKNHTAGEIMSI